MPCSNLFLLKSGYPIDGFKRRALLFVWRSYLPGWLSAFEKIEKHRRRRNCQFTPVSLILLVIFMLHKVALCFSRDPYVYLQLSSKLGLKTVSRHVPFQIPGHANAYPPSGFIPFCGWSMYGKFNLRVFKIFNNNSNHWSLQWLLSATSTKKWKTFISSCARCTWSIGVDCIEFQVIHKELFPFRFFLKDCFNDKSQNCGFTVSITTSSRKLISFSVRLH